MNHRFMGQKLMDKCTKRVNALFLVLMHFKISKISLTVGVAVPVGPGHSVEVGGQVESVGGGFMEECFQIINSDKISLTSRDIICICKLNFTYRWR